LGILLGDWKGLIGIGEELEGIGKGINRDWRGIGKGINRVTRPEKSLHLER